jgi:hypothetical protein
LQQFAVSADPNVVGEFALKNVIERDKRAGDVNYSKS